MVVAPCGGPRTAEALPGFEPGLLDSKSKVMTLTLQCPYDPLLTAGLEPAT